MSVDRKDIDQADGISLDSQPRWLRDIIDYNNESAGRETGRVKRFLASSENDGPGGEKQKEERRFNALLRLLQDPNYARLYSDAADTVTRADEAVDRAMQKLSREAEIAATKIQSLKNAAAEMPDGKKVFRSKDGRLLTEDGKDVTDQKNSIKGFSPETPSWEEFQRARAAAEDIERRRRELDDYRRDVLDPAKQRLGDTDNPPTPEELDDIIRRTRNMPPDARAELESMDSKREAKAPSPTSSVAKEQDGETKLAGPDLFAQFRAASAVIEDDPFAAPAPSVSPKVV